MLRSGDGSTGSTATEERCCFSNSRHAGICIVTPGEGESCATILAYLNSPNTVGKTYCGSTTIRGGWRQVVCAEDDQQAAPHAHQRSE